MSNCWPPDYMVLCTLVFISCRTKPPADHVPSCPEMSSVMLHGYAQHFCDLAPEHGCPLMQGGHMHAAMEAQVGGSGHAGTGV